MKAKVVIKKGIRRPEGQELIYQIRAGKKGTGRIIGRQVIFWPWSQISVERANRIVWEIAQRSGITDLTWSKE